LNFFNEDAYSDLLKSKVFMDRKDQISAKNSIFNDLKLKNESLFFSKILYNYNDFLESNR